MIESPDIQNDMFIIELFRYTSYIIVFELDTKTDVNVNQNTTLLY